MALIRCPECGKEVSDLAPVCIHCGYPLGVPEERDARYALLLLNAGDDREATVQQLARWKNLTPEKAEELLGTVPLLLDRGLLAHQAQEARQVWSKLCGVKVVREENATSAERAAASPAVDFDSLKRQAVPKPVTFGTIVGGVLAALLIWNLLTALLAVIVGR